MIEFANPAALWFLLLIGPIVLLYLLKRRRQDRIVPSTMLWKQVVEDAQANTPFQRLRSNLLLLLQILAVVLLTALLAQPYFPTQSKQSRQWIFVMDCSASMRTVDEKPNRFEAARKKLKDLLQSVAPFDEVMLMSVGSEASIVQNFTKNQEVVQKKLTQLEVEDVQGEWRQFLLIVKPLLKNSPRPKVVIASDFANFPMQAMEGMNFDYVATGQSVENLGLTRVTIEPLPDTMQQQLLFFQIKNFSPAATTADVEIRQNHELIDAHEIQLKPLEEAEKAVRVTVDGATRFDIRIQPDDQFLVDNDFTLIARPRSKATVQLEVQNPFLERALQALPAVQIVANGKIKISDHLQKVSGIYFLGGANGDVAPIIQWDSAAPELRFVDAGLWRISNYQILEVPTDSRPLLETAKGVVAYSGSIAGKRYIVLGFRLQDSNLPMLAGFPIFIGNLVDWIQESLEPPLPTFTSREHTREGEIQSGHGYVNFANPAESNLTSQKVTGRAISETRAAVLKQDFSKWFLLALLATVILEWWVFHRKETV